ncbi:uncharacterized mitochondrial protein AtMg00810-like [Cryptomeria japonica]|uniref:uncharacterized mitochondrial protein AtMg00810-like n=1 Tax=Cryptomeria japonica TaxID=3369 RepID=UPI0027DA91B2|nr:uncharacterized mitochondrial protein AtMg00810-like [Cryptomeria japonica]
MLILVLYVDDLFLTDEDSLIIRCKKELATEFEMKDLGLMHYFLGLEVWQRPNEIILSQGKYTIDILKRFGMMDCKPMSTPMETNLKKLSISAANSDFADPSEYRQLIGSLMYLVNTRPDIYYAASALSQFMNQPKHVHLVAAKHILRYLGGTIGYGLKYSINTTINLEVYTDSDWVGSVTDRKSTSGICFSLGSTMISWASRKQSSVALSIVEAEYIASSVATREAVWLRKLLAGLFGQPWESIVIYCDNQSCIKMFNNLVFHDRSKHVETHYHYIRDMAQRGAIQLKYINTDEQVSDVLTKPLARVKFEYFREKLGMVENTTLIVRESQS